MPALVFIDHNLPERLANALGEYLHGTEPDRVIRVIAGTGRQTPVEFLRDYGWNETLRRGRMYGEVDPDGLVSSDEAITISAYDALSNFRRTRDELNLDWSRFYTNPDFRPQQGTCIYDTIVLDPPEGGEGEPMVENPTADYASHWCEVGERVVTFLIPLTGLAFPEHFNWDQVLLPPLDACGDPEWVAEREARREEANRERFLEIASMRDDGEIRGIRTRIADHADQLTSAQQMLEQNRQSLREQQELLDAVLARRDSGGLTPEAVEREYEALKRHAHVVGIRWSRPQVLTIRTDDIELTHPNTGDTTIVGRFSIDFNFETGGVSVHNLTNRRGNWDHPHVSNGDFCQGELAPTIHRLMSRRQIGAAVNMAVAALEYCDPEDDWGRHVEWWFGAPDAPDPTVDPDA